MTLITLAEIYPKNEKEPYATREIERLRKQIESQGIRSRPDGPMYRRLSAAVAEMKPIRAGTVRPARTWELMPDGNGSFIRRQVNAASAATIANRDSVVIALRRAKDSACPKRCLRRCSEERGTLRWEQGAASRTAPHVLLRVAVEHPGAVLAVAKLAA